MLGYIIAFTLGYISVILIEYAYECEGFDDALKFISKNTEGNSYVSAAKIGVDYAYTLAEQFLRKNIQKRGQNYFLKYIINGRLYELEVKPVVGPRATLLSSKELGLLSCKHLFVDDVLDNIR